MGALGSEVIHADVRCEISDEEAVELFYDSNLNQQSFFEWSYSQKIEAIKYSEKMIRVQSQHGKRTIRSQKERVELVSKVDRSWMRTPCGIPPEIRRLIGLGLLRSL